MELDLGFLKYIEHSGFMLKSGRNTLYIDPFKISNLMNKADVVFITHSHFDHFSENDLKIISGPDTQYVAPDETAAKLGSSRQVLAVKPEKNYSIAGINFKTVAAYNTNPERLSFHPKSNGWVGYIIETANGKVYHAGDTDLTDEMKKVKTDLALLPMGGKYVMNVDEAIKAANSINAVEIAPMHYKALLGTDGSRQAEERFKKEVRNSIILNQVQEPHYSF